MIEDLRPLLDDNDLLLDWALEAVGDVRSPTARRMLVEAKRADLEQLLAVLDKREQLSQAS